MRHKAYNTSRWRKLRECYIQTHPLCERCLDAGKVVAGSDVHHKKSPFNYSEGSMNDYLLYDENNLETLCKECHSKEHSPRDKQPEEIIDELDKLLNPNAYRKRTLDNAIPEDGEDASQE